VELLIGYDCEAKPKRRYCFGLAYEDNTGRVGMDSDSGSSVAAATGSHLNVHRHPSAPPSRWSSGQWCSKCLARASFEIAQTSRTQVHVLLSCYSVPLSLFRCPLVLMDGVPLPLPPSAQTPLIQRRLGFKRGRCTLCGLVACSTQSFARPTYCGYTTSKHSLCVSSASGLACIL
jgi:hypothetical protein